MYINESLDHTTSNLSLIMSQDYLIICKRELSWNGNPMVFYWFNIATGYDPVPAYENVMHTKISLGHGDELRICEMTQQGYEKFCETFGGWEGGSEEFVVALSKRAFDEFCDQNRVSSHSISMFNTD